MQGLAYLRGLLPWWADSTWFSIPVLQDPFLLGTEGILMKENMLATELESDPHMNEYFGLNSLLPRQFPVSFFVVLKDWNKSIWRFQQDFPSL